MKIRSVGTDLFHADGRTNGQTDMTELIVAFPIFANAPTNGTTLKPTKWDFPFLFFQGKMQFTYIRKLEYAGVFTASSHESSMSF
jgi:hypothetical protein